MECQCTDMAKQQFLAIRWPEIKLHWDEFSAGSDIYVKQRLLEWSWFLSTLFHLQHSGLEPPYGSCGGYPLYMYEEGTKYTYSRCVEQCAAQYVIQRCGCRDAYMPGKMCSNINSMYVTMEFYSLCMGNHLTEQCWEQRFTTSWLYTECFLIVLWSYRYCLEDLGDILAYILKGRHTGSGGTKLFVWRALTLRYCCCILVFRNKIHLQPNQLHGLYILHWMYVWVYRSLTHIYINGSDI